MENLTKAVEADKKAMGLWLTKQSRKICTVDSARAEEYKFDKKSAPQ